MIRYIKAVNDSSLGSLVIAAKKKELKTYLLSAALALACTMFIYMAMSIPWKDCIFVLLALYFLFCLPIVNYLRTLVSVRPFIDGELDPFVFGPFPDMSTPIDQGEDWIEVPKEGNPRDESIYNEILDHFKSTNNPLLTARLLLSVCNERFGLPSPMNSELGVHRELAFIFKGKLDLLLKEAQRIDPARRAAVFGLYLQPIVELCVQETDEELIVTHLFCFPSLGDTVLRMGWMELGASKVAKGLILARGRVPASWLWIGAQVKDREVRLALIRQLVYQRGSCRFLVYYLLRKMGKEVEQIACAEVARIWSASKDELDTIDATYSPDLEKDMKALIEYMELSRRQVTVLPRAIEVFRHCVEFDGPEESIREWFDVYKGRYRFNKETGKVFVNRM